MNILSIIIIAGIVAFVVGAFVACFLKPENNLFDETDIYH